MTARLSITIEPPNAVFVYEKKKLKAVIRGALGEIKDDARRRLAVKAGGGRLYRRAGGAYQASAAGQAPVSVTGALAKSLKTRVWPSGQGGTVSAAFYDLFLEFGATGGGRSFSVGPDGRSYIRGGKAVGKSRVLEPRPLLTAALDARAASIGKRVQDSIVLDVKFVKQK